MNNFVRENLTIKAIQRAESSANGNPRYQLTMQNESGEVFTAKTGVDASVSYAIPNSDYRDVPLRVVFDNRGMVVGVARMDGQAASGAQH